MYMEAATPPITGVPFSISAWVYPADVLNTVTVVGIGDASGDLEEYVLQLGGATGGDPIQSIARAGGTASTASTTAGYTANTWYHIAATFISTSSRAVYLSGTNKGTSVTTRNVGTPTKMRVGRRPQLTPTEYMGGRVAEVAVWNIDLSDGNVASLAAGADPHSILGGNLVFYAPLLGIYSPEKDYTIGARHLTLFNSPTAAEHPTLSYAPTAFFPYSDMRSQGARMMLTRLRRR